MAVGSLSVLSGELSKHVLWFFDRGDEKPSKGLVLWLIGYRGVGPRRYAWADEMEFSDIDWNRLSRNDFFVGLKFLTDFSLSSWPS